MLGRAIENISEKRIKTLQTPVARKARRLLERAAANGVNLRVTSAFRSYRMQRELYAQGRTKPGKVVTRAKPGQSWHNFGLAFDVVEIRGGRAMWENSKWPEIGQWGKELGLEWGGDWKSFKDRPHFQDKRGMTLAQAHAKYGPKKANNRALLPFILAGFAAAVSLAAYVFFN